MFVERLQQEHLNAFIKNHLKKDFGNSSSSWNVKLKFDDYQGEEAWKVHYTSKSFSRILNLYLLDDKITPLVSRDMEEKWIEWLHVIFGEEYKKWYLQKTQRLFD